jgi:hypothetical protein
MGSLTRYACYKEKMLSWISEKINILELALKGDKFFVSSLIIVGNDTLTCNNSCVPNEDYSTTIRNNS